MKRVKKLLKARATHLKVKFSTSITETSYPVYFYLSISSSKKWNSGKVERSYCSGFESLFI